MFYQKELDFLRSVLHKLHLQVELLSPHSMPDYPLDFGLRAFLGREAEYDELFLNAFAQFRSSIICKLTDIFRCCYVFMPLPETPQPTILLIGPYVTAAADRQQRIEDAERLGIPARDFRQMQKYYENVPVVSDENMLFALLNVFGEKLWGSADAYEILDINQELSTTFSPLPRKGASDSPAELLMNMQMLETRYAYENELIRTVSQGLSHRADKMLSSFSRLALEQRLVDPVRNMKNYSIICNTLLRKAAEQGGVHPVYLDSVSSDFAQKIEALRSVDKGQELMGEMIRSYCRLVKKHATGRYSAVIQRTIAYIDTDLSADLQLQTLARIQNVNASYLSSLFKKETGQTITEHIIQKRMDHAAHLLQTTRLQIQSVAQHCGISDANYFSKLFKKHTGMTPGEYRARLESTI